MLPHRTGLVRVATEDACAGCKHMISSRFAVVVDSRLHSSAAGRSVGGRHAGTTTSGRLVNAMQHNSVVWVARQREKKRETVGLVKGIPIHTRSLQGSGHRKRVNLLGLQESVECDATEWGSNRGHRIFKPKDDPFQLDFPIGCNPQACVG